MQSWFRWFNLILSNFIATLLLALVFLHPHSLSIALFAEAVPEGFGHVDYEGLYIVDGDKVDIIQGGFVIFGSLLVKDNATLILRNAQLQIFRPEQLYGPPTVANRGKLVVEKSNIYTSIWGRSEQGWETVTGADSILLQGDAEFNALQSSNVRDSFVIASDRARVSSQSSSLDVVKSPSNVLIENSYAQWLEIFEGSFFSITNSTVDMLICRTGTHTKTSFVSITNSHIENLETERAKSEIEVKNSTINWLEFDRDSLSSISVFNSITGLNLKLSEKNMTLTVKPFFAKLWNIHRDTPFHLGEGNLTLTETNVDKIVLYFSGSDVFLLDSKLYGLASESSKIYIINLEAKYISAWYSSIYLFDSTVARLGFYPSNATIVNTVAESIDSPDSTIEIWWHLKVVINDQAENPKPSTVVKIYDSDRRLVEEKFVNSKGLTQFVLLGKKISNNTTTFLGNYTVFAQYDSWSVEERISLQDSQTIFLTVTPLSVRLMTFLTTATGVVMLISMILIAIAVAVLLRKKFKERHQQPNKNIVQENIS